MHLCSSLLAAAEAAGRIAQLEDRLREALAQPLTGLMVRLAFVLGAAALGVYLMLPRGLPAGRRFERYIGAALATLSLALLVTVPISPSSLAGNQTSQSTVVWSLSDQLPLTNYTFFILGGLSVVSAVMMITSRNPVYSALWFAMVLLANSGLYLLQGAEFLSAATIIVYTGAIVVTFLFVLMLAQPSGAAKYDRFSREPLLSSVTGLIFAAALVATLHYSARAEVGRIGPAPSIVPAAEIVVEAALDSGEAVKIDPERHVVGLGRALFLDHVASVEVIGVLLLAAVVGAMLIAGHRVEPPVGNATNRISEPRG